MKSITYYKERSEYLAFNIDIENEKAFKKELKEWLKEYGSINLSDMLENFSSVDIYELSDPNDEINSEFESQKEQEALFEFFQNELGIDVQEILTKINRKE